MSTTEALNDYSATIKSEIEAAVEDLIDRGFSENALSDGDWVAVECADPDYVEIGYLLNTHRGHDLYKAGDCIHGLPVRVSLTKPRTIAIVAEDVLFRCGEWVEVEDGDECREVDEERRDVRSSIQW